jgi:hypothetical protein
MVLKGGVIVIGSLYWENHLKDEDKDNIRKDWRQQNLTKDSVFVKVPIRYGRESSTRNHTYTMIFSKYCENHLGRAIVLPFNKDIKSFEELEQQAFNLAKAEGICKKKPQLSSNWGSVGILINPKLKKTDIKLYDEISKKWKDLHKCYRGNFSTDSYKADFEIESPFTHEGLLNINWQEEMDEFDILIATSVMPIPKTSLTESDISKKMIEQNYFLYFKNNLDCNIETYQDEGIFNVVNPFLKTNN